MKIIAWLRCLWWRSISQIIRVEFQNIFAMTNFWMQPFSGCFEQIIQRITMEQMETE